MSKIALKINIAGRTYPLNVPEAEVEAVHNAAAEVNKAIDLLRKNYSVNDTQDLLAMSALQLLTKAKAEAKPVEKAPDYSDIEAALEALRQDLSNVQ
ncbi:MAG: cell division protein ZapA [Sphingomonadales bacterium]|jgi:cell division protein ZapA (FtsZ GTPase activity inhibitor)|nr:cell division protein ZapA [Sphingomonadales bacterium]